MKYYLVGIKGTGMSALAKLLKDQGNEVVGSDVIEHYFTEDSLIEKGITIKNFDKNNINSDYFYIIGNAFNDENIEVKTIKINQYQYMYYHDFIGKMLNKKTIACCGTHGKTTTTYFLTRMLDKKCNYIIGDGDGKGYDNELLVLEACEYKKHFLSYHPELLIINNIELDHTDFYKSIKELINAFLLAANNSKIILANGDDKNVNKIKHSNKITYGFKKNNDIVIKILSTTTKGYYIQVKYQVNYYLHVPYLGKHMIYNYVASYMALKILGYIPKQLTSNDLPKRRLTTINYYDNILIDDYAHHPTEIASLYNTLKLSYPNRKINVIFQPHTYERTIHFKRQFKKVLKVFDKVYLLDVFTSKREKYNLNMQDKIDKYFKHFNKIEDLNVSKIKDYAEIWVFLGAGLANEILLNLINKEKM